MGALPRRLDSDNEILDFDAGLIRHLPNSPGKKRGGKRRGRRFLTRLLFLVLLLVLAAYFSFHSSLFTVSSIIVNGNHLFPTEDVINVSGISVGDNIFEVDLRAAEDNLRKRPEISQVSVKRHFPETVIIEMEERDAYALLPSQAGFVEISSEGIVLKRVDRIAGIVLPIISGTGIDVGNPGKALDNKNLSAALQILHFVPSDQKSLVEEVDVHDPTHIQIFTTGGIRILVGDSQLLGEKIPLALGIVADLDRKVSCVDVRFPKSPVIK